MLYKNLFQLYLDNFQNKYFLLSDIACSLKDWPAHAPILKYVRVSEHQQLIGTMSLRL